MPKIAEIEDTPNPNAKKFILKEPLTWGISHSYDNMAQAEADPLAGAPTSATSAPAPGGLPAELKSTLVQAPLLPTDITRVSAPPQVSALLPYSFRFACTLPDHKRQLAGADLYLKGEEIVIAPDYEKLSGQLMARSTDNVIQLTVPAGALKPGSYRVTIAGQQSSRTWTLQVK